MTDQADPAAGPRQAFVAELDRLRRRAAHGTGRTRVSLEQLADATGVPRSTVHAYVRAQRLPPADVLDRIVVALGATPVEQAQWAERLERLAAGEEPVAPVAPRGPRAGAPRLLPAAPAGFVGRVDELARLDELLVRHDAPDTVGVPTVVGLTGLGGVGKTAVALRWAHANASRFPDGQLWVDLRGYSAAPPLDPADALERLLRAVGVGTAELPPDVDARADMFRSAVAESRMLLVLDNARNAAQVLPLLPGADESLTIVTSRDALRTLGVSVGAARVAVGRMSRQDSVALMTAELPADTAAEVLASGVVSACDGLPLAMRILRERLSPAGPADVHRLAEHLGRDRQALLESLDLNDESVDVSVRGAFDLSYRALSPLAARLFRLLPLYRSSSIEVDAVLSLLGGRAEDGRRAVDQLVAAHLLDPAAPGAVRVHDLVAGYAQTRLEQEETAETLRAARIGLYDHLLDRCDEMVALRVPQVPWRVDRPGRPREDRAVFPDLDAASAWVGANVDLLTATVADAAGGPLPEYAYALAERSWRVLYALGSVTAVLDGLAAVGTTARRRGDLAVAIELASLRGVGFGRATRLAEAERCFQEAVDLCARTVPPTDSGRDTVNIALVWELRGQAARSIAALTSIRGAGRCSALATLLLNHMHSGDVDAATRCFRELDADHGGDVRWIYPRPSYVVDLSIARGDWAGARERLPALAAAIDATVDSSLVVRADTARARVSAWFGDLDAAEGAALAAVSAARSSGLLSRQLLAEGVLAEVLVLAGRADEAVSLLTPQLARLRQLGLRYAECRTAAVLARALVAAGRADEAATVAEQAGVVARECGYRLLGEEIAGSSSGPVLRAAAI